MKPATVIGIVLILLGIVGFAVGGFSFHHAKKDVDREVTLNQSFHFEIYRACGSSVLIPMIESLWLQSGPCIRVAIYAFSDAGEVDTAHYHRSIVKAIAAQDAQAPREALVADISRPFAFLRNKLQAEAKKD